MRRFLLASAVFCAALTTATAQNAPPAIKAIRAQLFLEKSGTWSTDLVGSKKNLFNTVIGEGDAGEPASNVLVTLEFSGTPNGKSNTKLARESANVTITQTLKTGARKQLRAFTGFVFNDKGLAFRAFMLDSATCAPLEIEVKLGKSSKTAKVDFTCGE